MAKRVQSILGISTQPFPEPEALRLIRRNAANDGWELIFASEIAQDLASVLNVGNTTDGYDIVITQSSEILGEPGVGGGAGGSVVVRSGLGDGLGDSGDIILTTGLSSGGTAGSLLFNLSNTGSATPGSIQYRQNDSTFLTISPASGVSILLAQNAGNLIISHTTGGNVLGNDTTLSSQSNNSATLAAGDLILSSGSNAGSGDAGNVNINSGDSGGTPGDVNINTGNSNSGVVFINSVASFASAEINLITEINANSNKIIMLADPENPLDGVNLRTLQSFLGVGFNDTITTIDDSNTTLSTISIGSDGQVSLIVANVVAKDEVNNDGAGWKIYGLFKNEGGTITQISENGDGSSIMFEEREDVTWDLNFSISGTDVLLIVNGDSVNNVDWRAIGSVINLL